MYIGLPKGIELTKNMTGLEIVRRWSSSKTIILIFCAVFLDRFLIYVCTQAINDNKPLDAVMYAGIGVWFTYITLADCINRTYIRVDNSFLSIKHAPLPSSGNRTVDVSDIKQIYSKRHESRSRRSFSTTVTYHVCVLTRSRENIKLLRRIRNSEQALFIKQEIERFLHFQDLPARGEIAR